MTVGALKDIIMADAGKEAARVEKGARRESDKILADGGRRASETLEALVATARQNMEADKKRRVAAAELAARDKLIGAKQELIDRVFSMASARLNGLDEENYVDLAARLLTVNAAGGEEVLFDDATPLPARREILARANAAVSADQKEPLTMGAATGKIGRGFILRRHKVEINFAFASLIYRVREAAEGEVAKMLFKGADR